MTQQTTAIIDKFLTNASNMLLPRGFVAEKILPAVKVAQTTGKVANYGNGHLRIVQTVHTGEGGYRRIDAITRDSDTYDIEDHGLEGTITKATFANVEKPYDARLDETLALSLALQLDKEKALADTLTSTSVITQNTTLSGTSQYNNRSHADSTPIEDYQEARDTIIDAIGTAPNVAIMPIKVYNAMRMHGQLLDSLGYKYNRKGGLTGQELADALELDQIFVAEALYNSAKQGQTDSINPVWGKHVVYAKIGSPALRQKVLGYEMRLNNESPRTVKRWTNNTPFGSEGVAVADSYDQLLLNANCAYLIRDAIA